MNAIFDLIFIWLSGALIFMVFVEYYCPRYFENTGRDLDHWRSVYRELYETRKSVRLTAYLMWPYFIVWCVIYIIKILTKKV